MTQTKMTKAQVKKIIDHINVVNREDFPAGNINELFNIYYKDCDLDERWFEFKITINEKVVNRIDSAHGGYVAGVMDEAMGCALYFCRNDHTISAVTTDMRFNCMKPLFAGDKIVIRVQVEHVGKQTAVTTSEIYRGKEKCAIAVESWAMIKLNKDELKNCQDAK